MRFLPVLFGLALATDPVRRAFHVERSGDVVLSNAVSSSSVVFSGPSELISNVESESITPVSVANTIGVALGIGPISSESSISSLPVTNSYKRRARAGLLFDIQGVSAEELSALVDGKIAGFSSKSFNVQSNFAPADDLALLTTMSTGVYPSEHGIVGRVFGADSKRAFISQGADSLAPTLADALASDFQGQSLIVSASADAQLARSTWSVSIVFLSLSHLKFVTAPLRMQSARLCLLLLRRPSSPA